MDVIRVGIIGCGGIAHPHLEAYRFVDGIEIVGIADSDPEALEHTGGMFGLRDRFLDAEEMLKQQSPHVACILVPYFAHCQYVELAARWGVHVLCQKPMAGTREEVDRMIAVTDEAGVLLGINEGYRYLKPFRWTKRTIDSGRIGELLLMRYEEVLFWPEPPAPYQQLERFYNIEMGPHYYDSICWLSGKKPLRVFGAVRRFPTIQCAGENFYCCHVEFEGGLIARIDDTVAIPGRQVRDRIYLYGTRGAIAINGAEGALSIYEADSGVWQNVDMGDPRQNWLESFRLPMLEFAEAVRNGKGAPLSGREYKKAMDIAFAVYESSSTGQVVEMK